MKLLIGILGFLIFFVGKNYSQSEQGKITVYDYQILISNDERKELRDSTELLIDSIENEYFKQFIYKDLLADSLIYYTYWFKTDSLFYLGQYCEPKDTQSFKYNKEELKIYKYDYNVENGEDEESYIYWSSKIGLMAVYNYTSGALLLFENESSKEFLRDEFYNFIVKPIKKVKKQEIESIIKNLPN